MWHFSVIYDHLCCLTSFHPSTRTIPYCIFIWACMCAHAQNKVSATVQLLLKHWETSENQNRDSWAHAHGRLFVAEELAQTSKRRKQEQVRPFLRGYREDRKVIKSSWLFMAIGDEKAVWIRVRGSGRTATVNSKIYADHYEMAHSKVMSHRWWWWVETRNLCRPNNKTPYLLLT